MINKNQHCYWIYQYMYSVIEVKRTVTVQLVGSCSDLWKKVYWVLIWKWNTRWTVIWKEVLLNSTFDFKNHHCYWINQHFDLNLLSYFRKVPSPVADSLISTSVENSKWRILSQWSYCWCKCIYNMGKVWKYFCCFQKKKWSSTSNFFKKGKRISSVCQFLFLKYDEAGSDTSQIRIFKLHVALTLTQYEVWRSWRRARIQVSREVLPAQLFHWERSGFFMLGRKLKKYRYFNEVFWWKMKKNVKMVFLINYM